MKHLSKLMGPQLYAAPANGGKIIQTNISIERLRESRVINFTGYSWVDQKFQFGISLLKNSCNKLVVHDSDYLGITEYAEILKANGHEVIFVLGKSNDWRRQTHPFSRAAASNKRIRSAFALLKEAGVKVRKFQDLGALTRYLDKAVQGE